jgi:putative Mg2+ transporter-C (MgtC) family protein
MNLWMTMAVIASGWSGVHEVLREELSEVPDSTNTFRVLFRMFVAVVLGGLLGWQRQREHKPAGMRTHMLVALGTALFVIVSRGAGMGEADLSRVIQGALTGIGFIGGGAILKLKEEHVVEGLTTAASIWVAAGIGIGVGLGRPWSAMLGTAMAFLILAVVGRLEHRLFNKSGNEGRLETSAGPHTSQPQE